MVAGQYILQYVLLFEDVALVASVRANAMVHHRLCCCACTCMRRLTRVGTMVPWFWSESSAGRVVLARFKGQNLKAAERVWAARHPANTTVVP